MTDQMNGALQHEGLDRTHMLIAMLEVALGYPGEGNLHPAIWNDTCKDSLIKVNDALTNLYQAIGQWEE